jgi:DNA-binding transcriptional MerR regulator
MKWRRRHGLERAAAYGADVGKRLITTAEAARELGVSRSTLGRYVRLGLLTPTRTLPSGHHRWDMEELERQLRELRQRDEE